MAQKTVEAWRNLWFHTGARVVRDADGYFKFVDRMKDAIRRRGENISSFEAEQVLLSHPEIATAAVFPVPSDMAEDEVMASVAPAPGRGFTAIDLGESWPPGPPYFATPRYGDFVPPPPVPGG